MSASDDTPEKQEPRRVIVWLLLGYALAEPDKARVLVDLLSSLVQVLQHLI
jgi:hypothetical protein